MRDVPAAIRDRDAGDPLASFRAQFELPEGVIYLDGNSLGALPRASVARLDRTVRQEWGGGLIRSWNDSGWVDAPARIGAKIAPLIGAAADEVVVADSTSVNLFKLLMAALSARPGRNVILSEEGDFPTDLYIAQGIASFLPQVSFRAAAPEKLPGAITDDVAVALLTHVHYKSGRKHDMAALTARTHQAGALTLWDVSHSAGAVAVELGAAKADMAVGCGYKYLNGGPGAPAFLFVARALQNELRSPITGWFGHAAPFAFDGDFKPAPGIGKFLSGTPPILGLMALEAGIDVMAAAPRPALFAKGQALCTLFMEEVDKFAAAQGLQLLTSRDEAVRGSHVSLRHADGYAIVQALIARGVIGDFRSPDILRFGFAPLYLAYEDAWRAAQILRDVLESRAWDQPQFKAKARVT